jgi:hypothetical protein
MYNDLDTRNAQVRELEDLVTKAKAATSHFRAEVLTERGLRTAAEDREKKLAEEKKALEEANEALKAELEKQKGDAEQKGYDLAYEELTCEYQDQVKGVYSDRFKEGAEWCHKVVLELGALPDDSAIRQMPYIPPELLVLPPTAEEPQRTEDHPED